MGFMVFVAGANLGERRVVESMDAPLLREPMGVWSIDGPGGVPGLLIAESDEPAARCRFVPQLQEWAAVGDGRWLGWWRGERPGPADLERPQAERVEGLEITLEDGKRWNLPRVMLSTGQTGLPAALGLTRDGKLQRVALARYRDLAHRGRRLWEFLAVTLAGGTPRETLDDAEILGLVMDGLAVNYRVDREAVSALALLSERNLLLVACEMVGIREMQEAQEARGKAAPALG